MPSGDFGGIFYEVGCSNRGSPLWHRKSVSNRRCTFGGRDALKGSYWGKEWADMGKGQYGHLNYDVGTLNKGEPLLLKAAEVSANSTIGKWADPTRRSRRASVSEGVPLGASLDAWRAGRRASAPTLQVAQIEHATGGLHVDERAFAAPAAYKPASASAPVSVNNSCAPSRGSCCRPSSAHSSSNPSLQASHRPSRKPSPPPSRDGSRPPSRGQSRRPSSDMSASLGLIAGAGRAPFMAEAAGALLAGANPARPASSHGAISRPRSSGGRPGSAAPRMHTVKRSGAQQVELITPASRLEAILQQHAGQPDESGPPARLGAHHVLNITVEHCVAPRPSRTLRGSSAKYAQTLANLHVALHPLAGEGTLNVVANANAEAVSPRIGSFEVHFTLVDTTAHVTHGPFPLFSKLERGAWPNTKRLAAQVSLLARRLDKMQIEARPHYSMMRVQGAVASLGRLAWFSP